jgi:hypothetical protein
VPLIFISRSPQLHPDGLEVTAANSEGSSIRVLVTREAINSMNAGSDSYMDRLKANLSRFREVASAKYDAGLIEADGHVIILREDLTQWSMD